jgi:hypothetical protein
LTETGRSDGTIGEHEAMMQFDGHGSLLEVLPSSHDSPGSCVPFPHTPPPIVVLVLVVTGVVESWSWWRTA